MKKPRHQFIVSPDKLFLIMTGDRMIKIKKGISKEQTLELLGEPNEIKPSNNPNNLRIRYLFKDIGLSKTVYEIFFRDNMLEMVVKTKNK